MAVRYEKLCGMKHSSPTKPNMPAHKTGCAGMASNITGVTKRIIIFDNEGKYMMVFNPGIIRKSGPYGAEEGCLFLTGWTGQIIQHEIDRREGILI